MFILRTLKVHFIGIGGTGMGSVAQLLQADGHEVRGADTGIYPPMSDQLADAGIPVASEYGPANLEWGPDRIVVGNICRADHPEVVAAQQRGIALASFPSILEDLVLPDRVPLVVAGTHGKTTTTSMLSWILRVAELDPSFLIGGVCLDLRTSAHLGQGPEIVLEGDEYDTAFFDKGPKFLHYRPRRAVLTSVEFDHADIFDSMDAVRGVFSSFVESIDEGGDLVVNMEDSEALGVAASAKCTVVRYRVLPEGTETPERVAEYESVIRSRPGARRTVFELFERGESLGPLSIQLQGRHNVANATAAAALARRHGVGVVPIREALRRFRGVRRRQELLGMAQGVRVIFDFAHHPTAAALTTHAVRRRYPDHGLHVCFEPRSSSSHRRAFAEGFAASFDAATGVYVAPLHRPEKVDESDRLDPMALATAIRQRGVDARAFDTIEALGQAVLDRAVPGDTVLLLSSGAFGGLGPRLLSELGDPVVFATPADQDRVDELLSGYGIPGIQSKQDVETLVMRRDDGGVSGSVSLQTTGDCAFLFGLAVTPERRGEGLGWVLGDCVLRRSRTLGVRRVYLVTSTAADFFAGKLGFRPVDADAVDPGVRETTNFAANVALPQSVCMVLDLPPD